MFLGRNAVSVYAYPLQLLRPFLVLALLLSVALTAQAGKLYKIVDENGNVTFSQFPPTAPGESGGVKVEEQKVSAGGQTAVTTRGNDQYCGDINLPSDKGKYNSKYFHQTVANRLEYWRERLNRYEKQLDQSQQRYLENSKYKSRYYSSTDRAKDHLKRDERTVREMRDLRCAISWAESQQSGSRDERQEASAELNRLQAVKQKVEAQMTAQCGMEPIYDPSVAGNRDARSKWNSCSHRYRSDIRRLENMIREESRKTGAY